MPPDSPRSVRLRSSFRKSVSIYPRSAPVVIFTWFDIEKNVLFNREFKQRRFLATHVHRKWTFISHWRSDYEQMFGLIVSIRVKTLSNTNLVASRHQKREREKREKAHFRLTRIAQKRSCLSSLIIYSQYHRTTIIASHRYQEVDNSLF